MTGKIATGQAVRRLLEHQGEVRLWAKAWYNKKPFERPNRCPSPEEDPTRRIGAVSQEVLVDPCPICGQSPLTGDGRRYVCATCHSEVERERWLGILPRPRFVIRSLGTDYGNAEADLVGRRFTLEGLKAIGGTCYTDADLQAIAAGDLQRIRPPTSLVAHLIFEHMHEQCYIQLNRLTRAEGPPLPEGADRMAKAADPTTLQMLDRGNLFISNQRLVFSSDTHTTIRIDRKLTGVRGFTNAFAVQRKGEGQATYFLGCESRQVGLVLAYLQGRLDHLR